MPASLRDLIKNSPPEGQTCFRTAQCHETDVHAQVIEFTLKAGIHACNAFMHQGQYFPKELDVNIRHHKDTTRLGCFQRFQKQPRFEEIDWSPACSTSRHSTK